MLSLNAVVALLLTYKYVLLFPLSIIEGPILVVIGGFLVTLGVFNPFLVLGIVVVGDMVGDSGLYALGRFAHGWLHRHGHRIGATHARIEEAKLFFTHHHKKAVTLSKLFHGVGFTGLLVAGSLKVPYMRFMLTCLVITLIQSTVLMFVGIFFGHAYTTIATYFDRWVSFVLVCVLVGAVMFAFFRFKSKKIS